MICCVVIAMEPETRDFMAHSLEAMGTEVILLPGLGKLSQIVKEVPISGILLEVMTGIKAGTREKEAAREFFEMYPFGKFKLSERKVVLLGESLDKFVMRCREFEPRIVRDKSRHLRFLPVLLSRDATFSDAEKSVTTNISEDGIFLFSAQDWDVGSRVWVRFYGEDAVMAGIVRRWTPWGTAGSMPGIGVHLEPNENAAG